MKTSFFKACALTIALLMIFSFLLAGCASKNKEDTLQPSTTSDGNEKNAPPAKEITVTIWAYPAFQGKTELDPSLDYDVYYKWIGEQLKAKKPNISTAVEIIPFNGGHEKINVALASGTAPDMLQDTIMRNLDFANRGKLVELDDVLTNEDISDFYDGILEQCSINNKLYVIPLYTMPTGFVVNKSLFEKANALHLLPANEDKTWTYDEFLAACKAVTKDDVYGYGLFAGNEQGDAYNFSLIWGAGARTFNEDRTECTLNSPEGVKGLEFLLKLIDEKVVPPGSATIKAGEVLQMFINQKVAICFSSTGSFASIEKGFSDGAEKFEYDFYMIPGASGKEPKNVTYINGFSIFNNGDADKINASKDYILIANEKENLKVAKAATSLPVRKSVGNLYPDDKLFAQGGRFVKFGGDYGWDIKGFAEIRATFFPELQAAFTKQKTSKQALDDFAAQVNKILESNK